MARMLGLAALTCLLVGIFSASVLALDVSFRVVDQNGSQLTGSEFYVLPYGPSCWEDQLISLEPGTYSVRVFPAGLRNNLCRDDIVQVTAVGTVDILWRTAVLQVDLVDQYGVRLAGSDSYIMGADRSIGIPGTVVLPVTEDPEYPQIDGTQMNGYGIRLWPGICGHHPMNDLMRDEYHQELPVGGATYTYVWPTATLTMDYLVDQYGNAIPGSAGAVLHATEGLTLPFTVTLPVTEDPGLPNIEGIFATGYRVTLWPGLAGTVTGTGLSREEVGLEVSSGGATGSYVWPVMDCNIRVVDGAENEVPEAGLNLLQHQEMYYSGDAITLPTTDESLFPGMSGLFLNGYRFNLFGGSEYLGEVVFEVTSALEFSPMFYDLGGNGFGLRCGQPPVGTVNGYITAGCPVGGTPLYGVRVDAYLQGTGDLTASAVTNESGNYFLPDLAPGDYVITVVSPLGYDADLDEVIAPVAGGASTAVDFSLACLPIAAEPRSIGFWKHQVGVALGGRGAGEIDGATLCAFLDLIAEHFNSNAINQVVVYEPPVSGLCTEKLAVARDLLNLKGSVGITARAKQQFLALLFNVAAGKLGLNQVVSADGATLSQAITYSDRVIDDLNGDHEIAKSICDDINNNRTVAAGVIPLLTENIAYKPGPLTYRLEQNFPNPFNPATTIAYVVPHSSRVRIDIVNLLGQTVRTVLDGEKSAGSHSVEWDGKDQTGMPVSSGMYFYRMSAADYCETKKMLLVK